VRIRNCPDRERLIPLDQVDHFELLYRGMYLSSIQRVDLTLRSGYDRRLEQLMVILKSGRRIRIHAYRGPDKQRAADWLNDELTRFMKP